MVTNVSCLFTRTLNLHILVYLSHFYFTKEKHRQGTRIPESNGPFRKLPYFVPGEVEVEEYSHKLPNASQMLGHRGEVKILSHTLNLSIMELLSPEKFYRIHSLVGPLLPQNIPSLPKNRKVQIFSQKPNHFRDSARLQYPFYCAFRTTESPKSGSNVTRENRFDRQGDQRNVEQVYNFSSEKSGESVFSSLCLVGKKMDGIVQ